MGTDLLEPPRVPSVWGTLGRCGRTHGRTKSAGLVASVPRPSADARLTPETAMKNGISNRRTRGLGLRECRVTTWIRDVAPPTPEVPRRGFSPLQVTYGTGWKGG